MLLNAVMCVWNEEDIIESTVKHLLAQGCAKVFIVDNASSDHTIKNALRAGALLAARFETKYFEEYRKVSYLNTVVGEYNKYSAEDRVWWLYADADEFPDIQAWPIAGYLQALPSEVRAVHGYLFNHIPTHPPYHAQGYHPADFQPLCAKSSISKIPLLRYDKGQPHLWSTGGAHNFIYRGSVIPTIKDSLHIHHFPYRNPEFTFKRLKKLVDRNGGGDSNIDWTKEFSKQICKSNPYGYESRYNQLRSTYKQNKYLELKVNSLCYNYNSLVRWYDIHMHTNHTDKGITYENSIYAAIYYFFLKEYDIALCIFNDILGACNDIRIKCWLMVKIAECLASTEPDDARKLVSSVKKFNNAELNSYIYNIFADTVGANVKDVPDTIAKVDFYQNKFAPGVEEKYKKMTTKIEDKISRSVRNFSPS
jgi:glycosyltransferase involved in cell wall biosynthesis